MKVFLVKITKIVYIIQWNIRLAIGISRTDWFSSAVVGNAWGWQYCGFIA